MRDPRAESLRFARVVKLYHDSADVVFVDDGFHSPRVPLMRGFMTSDAGTFDQPEPDVVTDQLRLNDTSGRVMMAVIGFVKGYPVILGTLSPATCAMLFEPNRYVHRLPSDVVVTSDPEGNVEVYHPSGTYLRIGETPEHDDLTGKDLNGRFRLTRNTDRAPRVRLVVASGGSQKAMLDIDPDGNVTLEHDGNLAMNTGGSLSATVAGSATVQAGGEVTVDAGGPATVTAPSATVNASTTINGSLSVNGPLSVSGQASLGGGLDVSGTMTNNGVNVGGTHTHPGVASGDATTGPPQ